MAPDKTILDKWEYPAKFAVGPTAPKPGPMLLKHAATAEKLLSKSKGSMEMIKKITVKQIK